MTSPDGINWTSREIPAAVANNFWHTVCFGNGLFVAIAGIGAEGKVVMTSPDGVDWTVRTSPANNVWRSVTYGNGLFVAVASSGTGNRVMTSPDGINWTLRTSVADNDWRSVTYGNGLFVAVASSGTGDRVMTSPDGITWTLRTSAVDNQWVSVTYGNGLFVAVSQSAVNSIMTSSDGITWTSVSTIHINWNAVSYGNGMFVAVASISAHLENRIMTSSDGITWTFRTIPEDYNLDCVCFGNGLFVALATGQGTMTSGFLDTEKPNQATKEEAEAGTVNDKYMTPERTKQAIAANVPKIYAPCDIALGATSANGVNLDRNGIGFIVGGVALEAGMRVFIRIRNATSPTTRDKLGIYIVSEGIWERADDMPEGHQIKIGEIVPVLSSDFKGQYCITENGELGSEFPVVGTRKIIAEYLDISPSTQTEAETGTVNDKYMTPLRTKQAISALSKSLRSDALIIAAGNSSDRYKSSADFVCTGSGSGGDDGAFINACMDNIGSGTIKLLPGTYVVNGTPIKLKSGMTLEGSGTASTQIIPGGSHGNQPIIKNDSSGNANIHIRDLTLGPDQPMSNVTVGGIEFASSDNCSVVNVLINGVSRTGISMQSAKNITVRDCVITDIGCWQLAIVLNAYAVGIMVGGSCSGIQILNNRIDMVVSSGFGLGHGIMLGGSGCMAIGNRITNIIDSGATLGVGIGIELSGERNIVHSNTIIGYRMMGMLVKGSDHSIQNNVLRRTPISNANIGMTQFAIRIETGAVRNVVTNNDLFDSEPLGMDEIVNAGTDSVIFNNRVTATPMSIPGGTFNGIAIAQSNTSYTTRQVRNTTLSTSAPSGGLDGDIWIRFT
jgi:hypothetical protein